MGKYIPKTELALIAAALHKVALSGYRKTFKDAFEQVIEDEKTLKELLDKARNLGIVKE